MGPMEIHSIVDVIKCNQNSSFELETLKISLENIKFQMYQTEEVILSNLEKYIKTEHVELCKYIKFKVQ